MFETKEEKAFRLNSSSFLLFFLLLSSFSSHSPISPLLSLILHSQALDSYNVLHFHKFAIWLEPRQHRQRGHNYIAYNANNRGSQRLDAYKCMCWSLNGNHIMDDMLTLSTEAEPTTSNTFHNIKGCNIDDQSSSSMSLEIKQTKTTITLNILRLFF